MNQHILRNQKCKCEYLDLHLDSQTDCFHEENYISNINFEANQLVQPVKWTIKVDV